MTVPTQSGVGGPIPVNNRGQRTDRGRRPFVVQRRRPGLTDALAGDMFRYVDAYKNFLQNEGAARGAPAAGQTEGMSPVNDALRRYLTYLIMGRMGRRFGRRFGGGFGGGFGGRGDDDREDRRDDRRERREERWEETHEGDRPDAFWRRLRRPGAV